LILLGRGHSAIVRHELREGQGSRARARGDGIDYGQPAVMTSHSDDRNCRPRGQVLDKFLKGTPGQKRTTKSASQTVEPPGTPLPEPELNRQTQQSSRSAHRRAWRCADVDTLNIQSVTPSTRHQAGLDFRPRATLRTNFRIVLPDFLDEPHPVALSHPDELAVLVLLIDGNHVRRRALLLLLDPPEPSPECYCLTVVESAP
jgi:hypothetical protein